MKLSLAIAISLVLTTSAGAQDYLNWHEPVDKNDQYGGTCDTDSDCMEKYPCGTWYGNDLYSPEMSADEVQATYEKCLDEQELKESAEDLKAIEEDMQNVMRRLGR